MKARVNETGTVAVMKREFARIKSRRIYHFILLILPLTTFFLFALMFKQNVPRELPVAVMDGDNSALSRKIVRLIDSLPSVAIAENPADMAEGRDLLMRRNAYALLVIPDEYEHRIFRGEAPQLLLYYNNQYMMVAGNISKDIYSAVRTLSVKGNIGARMKKGAHSWDAKNAVSPIEVQTHVMFNPYMNYTYYLVAALLPTMLAMFVLLSAVFAFGVELKDGSALELMKTAGGSVTKLLAGKLLPYTLVYSVIGWFMLVFLFTLCDLPLRGSFMRAGVAVVFLVAASQSVGVLFVSCTSNLRVALMGTSFYASTAFTFIGMTFPIMAMPLAGKIWAELLPLTHFIRIFVNESLRGADFRNSIVSFGALLLFMVLPVLLSGCIRTIFTNEKYWGGR